MVYNVLKDFEALNAGNTNDNLPLSSFDQNCVKLTQYI